MTEKKYTGFYHDRSLPIKRGQKVRVPKGTFVWTTHPSKKNGPSQRTQVVKVNHLLNGQGVGNNPELDGLVGNDLNCYPVSNPRVVWVGTGYYWFEVDINDVEVVE